MSKRLQVLLPDPDYKQLLRLAKEAKKTISEVIRGWISEGFRRGQTISSDDKLAAVMRLSKTRASTGDIDKLLSQIESGRDS